MGSKQRGDVVRFLFKRSMWLLGKEWTGKQKSREARREIFKVLQVNSADGFDQGSTSRGRKKWTNVGHFKDSGSPGLGD